MHQPAAYEAAIKARKALPDAPELAELLGRLSYEKKEYQRAVQLLQGKWSKKDSGCRFLVLFGNVSEARQKREARGALNQALSDGLQEPLAKAAKRALADLGRE